MVFPTLPMWISLGALNLITLINYGTVKLCRADDVYFYLYTIVFPGTLMGVLATFEYMRQHGGLNQNGWERVTAGAMLAGNAYALAAFCSLAGMEGEIEDGVLMALLMVYAGALAGVVACGEGELKGKSKEA